MSNDFSPGGFAAHKAADARLVILRGLYEQTDHTLNETLLQKVLETYGHNVSRDYVRTQLRALKDLGAVWLLDRSAIMVASLTRAGVDHVERRAVIEGVARPSPEV